MAEALAFVDVLTNLGNQAVAFLPNLLGAVILLVVGLVVGKIVGRVVKEVLDRAKVDYYVSEGKKPVVSLSYLFSLIVKWWIYLAFITAAVSSDVRSCRVQAPAAPAVNVPNFA